MVDFRKLGLDRMATGIAKSVSGGAGQNITTGDIGGGALVTVTFDNVALGSAEVGPRRTAALPAGMDYAGNAEWKFSLEGDVLVVTTNGNITGSFTFWVF